MEARGDSETRKTTSNNPWDKQQHQLQAGILQRAWTRASRIALKQQPMEMRTVWKSMFWKIRLLSIVGPHDDFFFLAGTGLVGWRLQLSVPNKLIETNKHKKAAVKQRSEYLITCCSMRSGCSARRKFFSGTQQK